MTLRSLFYYPPRGEIETRRRIRLSVAAYHYEFVNTGTVVMSDEEFDSECMKIDLTVETGNIKMDKWFKKYFIPNTGQWVQTHPEKDKLNRLYNKYYRKN